MYTVTPTVQPNTLIADVDAAVRCLNEARHLSVSISQCGRCVWIDVAGRAYDGEKYWPNQHVSVNVTLRRQISEKMNMLAAMIRRYRLTDPGLVTPGKVDNRHGQMVWAYPFAREMLEA